MTGALLISFDGFPGYEPFILLWAGTDSSGKVIFSYGDQHIVIGLPTNIHSLLPKMKNTCSKLHSKKIFHESLDTIHHHCSGLP
jgi:hypothetical protein